MKQCKVRFFILGALFVMGAHLSLLGQAAPSPTEVPSYLKGYEAQYAKNPRTAAQDWYRDAKFGIFFDYGIESLLPGGAKYFDGSFSSREDLEKRYTAEKFDANALADLAVAAGAHYICFSAKNGGGPYNFRSAVAHPNSYDDCPAKRDLTAELAKACRSHGLGLFLYVHWSIAQSNDEVWPRNQAIFRDWLTQYGPLAGLWFDTDSYYYKPDGKSLYPRASEMFSLIRSLQPQTLISWCHGVTGDEDYITYEHHFRPQSQFDFVPDEVKKKLSDKPVEIITTMQLDQKGGRGTKMWTNVNSAYHRNADEVIQLLAVARRNNCNLLLNSGLMGDGSINPADERTLREVGKRLHANGWPAPAAQDSTDTTAEDR